MSGCRPKDAGRRGAEIGVDLACLEKLVDRPVFTDVLDVQRPIRPQIHVVVRPPACVDAALEPGHAAEVDIVVVAQDAADPDPGGLPVLLNADPLALEVLRFRNARLRIDENKAVAKQTRREHRQRDEGEIAFAAQREVVRGRHFRHVEGVGLHHAGEDFRRRLYGDVGDVDPLGLHGACLNGLHPVVRTACHRNREFCHHFLLCCDPRCEAFHLACLSKAHRPA